MRRTLQILPLITRRTYCSSVEKKIDILSQIPEAIRLNPAIKFDPIQWQQMHDTFHQQGLSTSVFMSLVNNNPTLLTKQPKTILNSLEIWRGTQFGDKSVFELLERNPAFLELTNEHHLRKRIGLLKSYGQTLKNVWRIFMNAPNTLTENASNLNEKIDYFNNVMKIDVAEVVKSQAFSHSINSIRTRHVFLERLGLFKCKNPKVSKLEQNKNPRMYQIMDTSDFEFAIKIAQVTIDEFETFQLLYERELEKRNINVGRDNSIANNNNNVDEDDDSDVSDDEHDYDNKKS